MANKTTTFRLDMSSAPGAWSTGPAFTQGRADFGLAYDAGTNTLYALGGDSSGGGFFDSTNFVDELSVARLACWNLDGLTTQPDTAQPPGQPGGVLWSRGYLECRRHKRSNLPVPR